MKCGVKNADITKDYLLLLVVTATLPLLVFTLILMPSVPLRYVFPSCVTGKSMVGVPSRRLSCVRVKAVPSGSSIVTSPEAVLTSILSTTIFETVTLEETALIVRVCSCPTSFSGMRRMRSFSLSLFAPKNEDEPLYLMESVLPSSLTHQWSCVFSVNSAFASSLAET